VPSLIRRAGARQVDPPAGLLPWASVIRAEVFFEQATSTVPLAARSEPLALLTVRGSYTPNATLPAVIVHFAFTDAEIATLDVAVAAYVSDIKARPAITAVAATIVLKVKVAEVFINLSPL
jgi:hypothetical protein